MTAPAPLQRVFSTIACLMGAGGVIAAAAAAHVTGETRMAAAAQILMVHAAATLALARASGSRLVPIATAAIQAGAILFAADMTVRTVFGQALFPFAAPIGGTVLILAWLAAAAGFAFSRRSTGQ